jgi:hypothetical protein
MTARGGVPGRLVRAIGVRRRGITAVSLGLVAYALPAHADPGSGAHTRAARAGVLGAASPGESAPASRLALRIDSTRSFYAGARPVRLTVALSGSGPVHVLVETVRRHDGLVVDRRDLGVMEPGVSRDITWDGTTGRHIQPEGTYAFRVVATPDERSHQDAPAASERNVGFVFLRHRFPVRGRHGFGDAGARFGAGRGGGGHQGQDVFAACGTPLVAARGGTVQYAGYHGRAGNYLVIDGAGTGVDYVYAHLRDPVRLAVGRHVFTGQPIGFVGRTGDATACHLHFEMWSGPGWYAGGAAFDPLPLLRGWDRAS